MTQNETTPNLAGRRFEPFPGLSWDVLDEIASRAALYDPFADPADVLSIDPDTGEIME